MRYGLLLAALTGMVAAAAPASAKVKTEAQSKYYAISGKTGEDLLAAMDRKGPRHGFLTRAIAQTSYTVNWEIEWTRKTGTCRVKDATASIDIIYSYPQVTSGMSPDLKRRWATFMKGVRKHEEAHGALAQKMVRAADRAITGYAVPNDPNCRKAKSAVKKRVEEVYAEYEAKQYLFDQIEHQPGGNVEGLVRALGRSR